ncbi:MAG: bacteriophage holin [Rhodothermales bacterium]|nr:bacteriophage holin [Rhodothermales bacterium]
MDDESQRRIALAHWLGVGRLNVVAFSVTCGLFWGLGLFLITWWIIFFDGATGEPTLIGRVYRGYSISALGSLAGLAWGLVDGLVGGAIFAWLYNRLTDIASGIGWR